MAQPQSIFNWINHKIRDYELTLRFLSRQTPSWLAPPSYYKCLLFLLDHMPFWAHASRMWLGQRASLASVIGDRYWIEMANMVLASSFCTFSTPISRRMIVRNEDSTSYIRFWYCRNRNLTMTLQQMRTFHESNIQWINLLKITRTSASFVHSRACSAVAITLSTMSSSILCIASAYPWLVIFEHAEVKISWKNNPDIGGNLLSFPVCQKSFLRSFQGNKLYDACIFLFVHDYTNHSFQFHSQLK